MTKSSLVRHFVCHMTYDERHSAFSVFEIITNTVLSPDSLQTKQYMERVTFKIIKKTSNSKILHIKRLNTHSHCSMYTINSEVYCILIHAESMVIYVAILIIDLNQIK